MGSPFPSIEGSDAIANELPTSSTTSTPTPTPTPTPSLKLSSSSSITAEEFLFKSFPGYTWSERSKDTTAWVWEFGYDVQSNDQRRWVCRKCCQTKSSRPANYHATGIQNATRHLFSAHKINAPNGRTKSSLEKKAGTNSASSTGNQDIRSFSSISHQFNLDTTNPQDQRVANTLIRSFDRTTFQRLLIDYIVDALAPLGTVNNPKLQKVFEYLNPSVKIQGALLTGPSITKKIKEQYSRHKQRVIHALANSTGQIHLSFDGWTSRNQHSLYGVVCFFRSEDGQPAKIVLGIPETKGRHFGYNIGGEILDIIDTFKITHRIGYATLDNAENNDTAWEVIGAELGFEGRVRRGRCFGHTINLSAKSLLFGSNLSAFEEELQSAASLSEQDYILWRKKGPVGKLHNLVVDIHRSTHLSGILRQLQQDKINRGETPRDRSKRPLNVILDNQTRWLSQLYMIRRAIRLRSFFALLIIQSRSEWEEEHRGKRTGGLTTAVRAKMPRFLREENQLTEHDWDVLGHIEVILTTYETVLRTLEGDSQIRLRKRGFTGSYGNVWDVVLGFEMLLEMLEEHKRGASDLPDGDFFKIGVNLAWAKLDHYYNKLDETPIYYSALALHPAYRWDWFEHKWADRPDWISHAKDLVFDLWLTEYSDIDITDSQQIEAASDSESDDSSDSLPPRKKARFFDPFAPNAMRRSSDASSQDQVIGDEYKHWISTREKGDRKIRDPRSYWHNKRHEYPRLSQMALDLLSVQAMSAECERLFSAAGRLLSPMRSNLDIQLVGMILTLRSWHRAGIVKDIDPAILSLAEEEEEDEIGTMSHLAAVEHLTSWIGRPAELPAIEDFD